jgi:hypothetical protein
MDTTKPQTKHSLLGRWEGRRSGPSTPFRVSRRGLLRSTAGVSVVGVSGLLELLAHREAIAAGMNFHIEGVTREPDEPGETPHRHTFSVHFRVTSVSPSAIIGDVKGRTHAVISTSSTKEDQHFHLIEQAGVSLEEVILSGTENNEPGEHAHDVSIE